MYERHFGLRAKPFALAHCLAWGLPCCRHRLVCAACAEDFMQHDFPCGVCQQPVATFHA